MKYGLVALITLYKLILTCYSPPNAQIGGINQKILKRKCSKLKMRRAVGGGLLALDKSEQEITELHTRIMVAIKSAESISNKIQKLRDEELQPQLVELLHG